MLSRLVSEEAAEVLAIIGAAIVESCRPVPTFGPVLGHYQAVRDYLHVAMAHRLTESARLLHLNAKNLLIRDEQISEGTIDQVSIYVREVARRALELGSAAVILVHNHPSGDPTPSRQDISLTRQIAAALKPLGVHLYDHLIIASGGHVSFRELGYI